MDEALTPRFRCSLHVHRFNVAAAPSDAAVLVILPSLSAPEQAKVCFGAASGACWWWNEHA